jgi:hypothetical protein
MTRGNTRKRGGTSKMSATMARDCGEISGDVADAGGPG